MRKEKGFTTAGVLVTIALASLIALGAGMTVAQIIKGTERNENHAEAVRQAQNLGRWFSRDALAAANITGGDDPETGDDELLSIWWKDWENGDNYDIRYIWLDDVGSLKQVKRNQVVRDRSGNIIQNTTTLIADSVYSANLSWQDDAWVFDIETHSGQRQTEREYKITQRLGW
jgi:type II secretory pathway component PulJ